MLIAAYRTLDASIPAPRTPELITPVEKGYTNAQPWQCKPWVDAQTLGLELRWTTEYTMVVTNVGGRAHYELEPEQDVPNLVQQFSDDYYGVCVKQQILLPVGFNGLTLPHPRFFDPMPAGAYNDAPSIVPGVLEMDWWPAFFFVVSRMPQPGAEHIFYAGEPFCQIVPVPRGDVAVRPMDAAEEKVWDERNLFVRNRRLSISTHTWKTKDGGVFGNAYKILSQEIKKLGWDRLKAKYPEQDSPEMISKFMDGQNAH